MHFEGQTSPEKMILLGDFHLISSESAGLFVSRTGIYLLTGY
jgi:hypothetical protein